MFLFQPGHSYSRLPQDENASVPKQNKSFFSLRFWIYFSLGLLLSLLGLSFLLQRHSEVLVTTPQEDSPPVTDAKFDAYGRYIMEDFDEAKPMSNFLPGVGGFWGTPLWAFYVNRGQALTSFGVQNKDGSMAKFLSAEKAYQQTPFTGFRTLIKGRRDSRLGGEQSFTHMPFFPHSDSPKQRGANGGNGGKRRMFVGTSDVEIRESQQPLGLDTSVLYRGVVDEDFPALLRTLTLTNTGADELSLELLDGLAKLVPAGLSNWNLDAMGRTMEAWMNVYRCDALKNESCSTPFFHISQGTADTAAVQVITEGHFAVSFLQTDSSLEDSSPDSPGSGLRLLPFIVDPTLVFGTDTALMRPSRFFDSSLSLADFMRQRQGTSSRTPCAFAGLALSLKPGEKASLVTVIGHAKSAEEFINKALPRISRKGFAEAQSTAVNKLMEKITSSVTTVSGSQLFDSYVKQSYLDNILRGGLPVILGEKNSGKNKVYHTFSRIHGDIERDYNNFQLDPTYFSQGPGNFRDVSQNRRLDVSLDPRVGDFNVRGFLSLVQADGFNPLTVATALFRVPRAQADELLDKLALATGDVRRPVLAQMLAKPFRVGQLFADMKAAGIEVPGNNREDFLNKVADASEQIFAAAYAQNGFWADHWTYSLDLVEDFLRIFPDRETQLLFGPPAASTSDSSPESSSDSSVYSRAGLGAPLPFFLSPAAVKPRSLRYSITDSPLSPGRSTVRVFNAVYNFGDNDFPPLRRRALERVWSDADFAQDSMGAGGVWQRDSSGAPASVSALGKLLLLGTLKLASLDPAGLGVEMEGGKPGWNDALNGLPALLGSGVAETCEMARILRFVFRALERAERRGRDSEVFAGIEMHEEFCDFLDELYESVTLWQAERDLERQAGEVVKEEVVNGGAVVAGLNFRQWERAGAARELYFARVLGDLSGKRRLLTIARLKQMLLAFDSLAQDALERAAKIPTTSSTSSDEPVMPTYFYYECLAYEIVPPATPSNTSSPSPPAPTQVRVLSFARHVLPMFLEGPVRRLKLLAYPPLAATTHSSSTSSSASLSALSQYRAVRGSPLFDAPLNMYTLSASLADMPAELGRMKAFSPGWLENQSVWLHMSYKWLLELLRATQFASLSATTSASSEELAALSELRESFFAELRAQLVCFQPPARYGRSPLEAASFLASSASPDPALAGTSFLARLSGSTAEMLSLWQMLTQGPAPFTYACSNEEKEVTLDSSDSASCVESLSLSLRPLLPAWLFVASSQSFSFVFLGRVTVTYHNPALRDSWLLRVRETALSRGAGEGAEVVRVQGGVVNGENARKVRDGYFDRIDIFLEE